MRTSKARRQFGDTDTHEYVDLREFDIKGSHHYGNPMLIDQAILLAIHLADQLRDLLKTLNDMGLPVKNREFMAQLQDTEPVKEQVQALTAQLLASREELS